MFSPKQSSCLLQPETIQGIKQAHTALYATTPASHNARSPHPCFRTSCVDRTLWPGTSRLRFAGVRHAFQPRELELLSPRTVAGTVNSFHPRMHSFPRYHSQHPLRLSNTTIVKTCQQYEPCATYAVAVQPLQAHDPSAQCARVANELLCHGVSHFSHLATPSIQMAPAARPKIASRCTSTEPTKSAASPQKCT